jgi:hypothetical protein
MEPIIPKHKLTTGKYKDLPVEIPVETPVETPVEIPVETPVEIPVEIPVETPVDTPDYKELYLQCKKDLVTLQSLYDKLQESIKTPIPPTPPTQPTPPKSNKITIVDYTDKSIVILGDTKSIKDLLKSNKCKYNPHLKCGSGWVCSKKERDNITKILTPYM